jgi:hypothetical protein
MSRKIYTLSEHELSEVCRRYSDSERQRTDIDMDVIVGEVKQIPSWLASVSPVTVAAILLVSVAAGTLAVQRITGWGSSLPVETPTLSTAEYGFTVDRFHPKPQPLVGRESAEGHPETRMHDGLETLP